jgi:hypothetical protein
VDVLETHRYKGTAYLKKLTVSFSNVLMLTLLFLVACNKSQDPDKVHLLVPEGYRGVIKIIVSESGQAPFVDNGKVTLKIPPDGTVLVDKKDLYINFTETTISDYLGQAVAREDATDSRSSPNANDVVFRFIGGREGSRGREIWAVIGTNKDAEITRKSMFNNSEVNKAGE